MKKNANVIVFFCFISLQKVNLEGIFILRFVVISLSRVKCRIGALIRIRRTHSVVFVAGF